ncbi:Arginine--tRNA ligase, cytoplasmic [Grifola frondosa]|uniref:arginine--tRNA ligase n=1 Tax=Grifola frondosa TaxID=5627 RepID=A0A1C7LPF1_GRIFR|nr:Arginine--tRNA ligase, cytoplasmic [Grifola frondosa]
MSTALQPSPFTVPSNLPSIPHVSETDPTRCVLDAFRTAIAQLVAEALPPLTVEQVYQGVDYGKKGVDFTVALPRFRLPGKVDELAKKVLSKFQPNEWIENIVHDRAFLHFTCSTSTLLSLVLNQVHSLTYDTASKQPEYGQNSSGAGKRVIIEYSSPNIAKSFHVGHLRSTIIGAFLSNLYKACGWEVISMNYLGDWGTQFGLIAVGFQKYGSQEELEKDAIKHLFEVYVKVNADAEKDPEVKVEAAAWFKRMEDGDEEALRNWRVWRELSVRKYEEEYARLNVHFDVYTGESQVGKEWQDKALDRLNTMGLIDDHEGAKLVNLEKWKLGKAVVRKKDGTSIYLTRDIGGAIERYEKYKFDKMIYVVASQQDLHLAQFFKVLKLMEFPWADNLEHVNYGLVLGMSTRKGTAVFLDQIIREAASVMHDQMRKNEVKYNSIEDPEMVAQEIGITGVKIQDMGCEANQQLYLQLGSHALLRGRHRPNPQLFPLPPPSEINTALLSEPAAREIVFLLGTYPDVVKTAQRTHEPSGVVTFAFRLSHAISSAWETVVVMGEADVEKARARMWMYICARDVLGAALRLLSIKPLERM